MDLPAKDYILPLLISTFKIKRRKLPSLERESFLEAIKASK